MLLDKGRHVNSGTCCKGRERQLGLQGSLSAMPELMDLLRDSSSRKKPLNSSFLPDSSLGKSTSFFPQLKKTLTTNCHRKQQQDIVCVMVPKWNKLSGISLCTWNKALTSEESLKICTTINESRAAWLLFTQGINSKKGIFSLAHCSCTPNGIDLLIE